MSRLFKYELKRLLVNKFFLSLLIISILYSRQVMCKDIILGVANTAPFSGWSYGAYLAKVLPILLVALLFFISFLYSKQEKSVQALTKATPIDPLRFQMLRCGAIMVAFSLIFAVPIVYSLWFYGANFHFTNFGSLALPTVITLLPSMLFVFGAGMLGGQCHQAIIFVLIVVIILINYFPLPYAFDLFGVNFFTNYPIHLGTVEPAFFIPTTVLIGKFIYGLLGIAMMFIASIPKKKNNS
ncbi:hypothetical protein [Clostridium tetanomorphum]|uniref:Uncharacterized protein n=1 Tax=Clostridium tetanomorphum TaxID=1553 RepID=A0A923E4R5_CLOTT|nr:hypothetical protein [Clostridium tetanomorphum]MBC2396405.1 hypothetical protein [Clostridium tetanomorphum]NRZ96662.1 ABC-2 type transport system permease protein [Clostridium tetanomorphum]